MTRKKVYNRESDVKREVKKLLDEHKFFWWCPPANGFGKIGVADFNALRSGVFLAVETKFGKNTVTAAQRGYLSSIAAEDGFAFIVNEDRLEWFKAWLEAFDRAAEAASKNEKPTQEDGAMLLNAIREMTQELI